MRQHREGYRRLLPAMCFSPIAAAVYHNDETASSRGVGGEGPLEAWQGLGISIADYDRDGHIDRFVAMIHVAFRYHNKRMGNV